MAINKDYLNGVLVSIFLGIAAIFLANFTPSFLNSILLALLIGIGINNVVEVPQKFQSGLSFTSGKMLELSIIFLAFSIDYKSIVQLGVGSFLVILITVFVVLISVFLMAKKFNCPSSTGWLIGFGTAICGSSAIAALAPSVAKDKEDVAVSMSVVNLFGSVGMILLPLILIRLPLDTNQIGILIGGSLHSVGNVVGAGYALSDEIGESAMTIKLARVALLSPALLFFNFLVNRKSMNHWTDYIKLPWYLIGFFIISIFS
ncbi:MAG: putative sulfate exporter family transporter, partial [Crocinitomicaceae bacterium]|nr:putative sulfate exporter family transporter [Crocinitomicaceae bacterium]